MRHILLIDDDPMVRRTLRSGLEIRNYRVSEACDGPSAIELLRRSPADLAVIDMHMPFMSGSATAAAIRAEFPGTKIVFLTGSAPMADDDYATTTAQVGAAAVLQKPIRPRQLGEIIERAFGAGERSSFGPGG